MANPQAARAAFEAALIDNPDDLATHAAYADWLHEQGDPRGEWIQIQLALEEEGHSPAERKKLQKREQELLAAHEAEWLGDLAPLLLGTPEEQKALFALELRDTGRLDYTTRDLKFKHHWSRGWLDHFECYNISVEMVRKLARCPLARLLRALVYCGDEPSGVFKYEPGPDITDVYSLPLQALQNSSILQNIRIFQFGEAANSDADQYWSGAQFHSWSGLIRNMPRLEELYLFGHIYLPEDELADIAEIYTSPTLSHLRIFQHYHGHSYPLERLAANPALKNLTHLLCFPHSFAREWDPVQDQYGGPALSREVVSAVVNSPHLTSLSHLQLRCCSGGDGMIEDLVSSGIFKRLTSLDLRHGYITDEGAQLIADCPDSENLQWLDLKDNRLTEQGIGFLKAEKIPMNVQDQQSEPFNDDHILYFGDTE